MPMILGGSGTISSDKISVDANGNVGIGTSSPSANVEISGRSPKLWISETSSTDTVELFLKQTATTGEGLKITYDSGTGDSTINNVYNVGNLYLQTNSNTKIIIDSSGRVRMPYQPAFYAYPSASTSYTANNPFIFNVIVENEGGGYNASNGRFTAPVAGRYMIIFHGLTDSNSVQCDFRVYINGSSPNYYGGYAGNWSGHKPSHGTWVIRLNAGDYVDMRAVADTFIYSAPHSYFSGYLIG